MNSRKENLNEKTRILVERARGGDQDAISDLYDLYKPKLIAGVRGELGPRLRSQMDSMDLVQSVWKDALQDIKDFEYRGPKTFLRWIVTRLLHKIRNKGIYFAAMKRDVRRLRPMGTGDSNDGESMLPPSDSPTPSQAAISSEEEERFHCALKRFPERDRRVLLLRFRDELTYAEIGKTIGKSPEATRKMIGRLLKELQRRLRAGDEDSEEGNAQA